MGEIWNLVILQPVINTLIMLSHYLFNSFGLAIVALTIVVNLCMYPLTLKQLHASKAMQSLQPKLTELQKKYAKDKRKLGQEQMRLYKESGISPLGCMVPMLIQMPIWISLYQSIIRLLAVTPEDFLGLSQYLYPWPIVYSMLPLAKNFLGLDLATPNMILAALVGGTMWLQQKMTTPISADPKQQAQSSMMLWMMPMMFGLLALSFPSGLALYWVTSSAIRIAMQYFATGWGGLVKAPASRQAMRDTKYKKRIAQVEQASPGDTALGADIAEPISTKDGMEYGQSGDKSQSSGGDYRVVKRQPGGGRGRRPKRK